MTLEDNRDISIERQLGEITVKLEYINQRLEEQSRQMLEMQKSVGELKIESATNKGSKKAMVGLGSLIGGIVGAVAALLTALAAVGWQM